MKRLLVSLVVTLVSVAVVSAAPLCTGPVTVGDAANAGCTSESGGLTFSDFVVTPGVGTPTAITLMTATQIGDWVYLTFNPSLSQGQDIWLNFTVTGPLGGIDLSVARSNAVVTEVACSGPITAGQCSGQELGYLTVYSGGAGSMDFEQTSDLTYIWKDIGVGAGGELSAFTQSFHVVPEPMTFALIGAGLLGLGLLRRKVRG
jgi:hypothetical protein